jgi:general secretion pathway protein D
MAMKTLLQKKFLACALIFCVILFFVPASIMGARVTGQDALVTTSDTRSAQVPKDTDNAQDERETVNNKAPAQGKISRPVPKPQPQEKIDSSKFVTIDFNDVDIKVFIKFMSELTGKNFVIDKGVRGNVTIVSPKKISVKEAYKVFESVLEVHDYAAVPAGDITKIIPLRSAREKNVETRLKREAVSPEDKVITQILSLNYASPDEMKKVLTPLVSKSSVIISYTPTGMLIVTDLLSNIQRLLKIIKALDIEGIEEQISVIPVQYASAPEIEKSLNLIFQQRGPARKGAIESTIKIVSDSRTNTLISLASENDTSRIKKLIELLDKEIPKGEAKVRVYRLQNADSEELTKVLMNIPSKEAKQPEAGKSPVLSKEIQIIPDKATNTLVITADRDEYAVLEEVIKELDIPRPMVYIEALIMEVNVDKGFNLGAEWVGGDYLGTPPGRTSVYGGSFQSGGIIPKPNEAGIISFPGGFSVGVLGEAIKIGDFTFPTLGAVFQAYQKDTDVHILSTPQILTLDNEEAEIYAGENRPFQTRAETSTANVDYSTYEYKDVGVSLKITPQINQERFVRLNLYQEVTRVIPTTSTDVNAQFRPSTFKRTAKTAVTVKDNHTIVIGGLVSDDLNVTTTKVPCLGNIPVLGWLFKYQSENRQKRNLFIFITPHIIENPMEAKVLYEEKEEHMNKIQEGVIKMNERNRHKEDEE